MMRRERVIRGGRRRHRGPSLALALALVGAGSIGSGCAKHRPIFQPNRGLAQPRTEPGLHVQAPFVDVQIDRAPDFGDDLD